VDPSSVLLSCRPRPRSKGRRPPWPGVLAAEQPVAQGSLLRDGQVSSWAHASNWANSLPCDLIRVLARSIAEPTAKPLTILPNAASLPEAASQRINGDHFPGSTYYRPVVPGPGARPLRPAAAASHQARALLNIQSMLAIVLGGAVSKRDGSRRLDRASLRRAVPALGPAFWRAVHRGEPLYSRRRRQQRAHSQVRLEAVPTVYGRGTRGPVARRR